MPAGTEVGLIVRGQARKVPSICRNSSEHGAGGNFRARPGDNPGMECERYRLAISARLDGEDPGLPSTLLDDHLTGCGACRRWQEHVFRLGREVQVRPAENVPDLTPAILAAIAAERAGSRAKSRFDPSALRWGLVMVGIVQLLLSAPALLGWDVSGSVHLSRELGSFDLALAVGFLFAAWRPVGAVGMLPVVAALVACLGVVTAVDVAGGEASLGEFSHMLEFVGLAFVWQLSRAFPTTPGSDNGFRRLGPLSV